MEAGVNTKLQGLATSLGRGVVLWDFEGTLAHRERTWSGVLYDLLKTEVPAFKLTLPEFRAASRVFPWHDPLTAHPHLVDPEKWWEEVERRIVRVYIGVGVDAHLAISIAKQVQALYSDPSHWILDQAAVQVLGELEGKGWPSAILSNNVPELPTLVCALGLADSVTHVFTSARLGFEKPHPSAFIAALRELRFAPDSAWMVGDNEYADVGGAEAVGIRAIHLTRSLYTASTLRAQDLRGAAELILAYG